MNQTGYYNEQDFTWHSWMVAIWQVASHIAHCTPSKHCIEYFRDVFSTDCKAVLQNTRGSSESTSSLVAFCRTANKEKGLNRKQELMQNFRKPWRQQRTSYLFALHVLDMAQPLRTENVQMKPHRHCMWQSALTVRDLQEVEYLHDGRNQQQDRTKWSQLTEQEND